MSTLRSKLFQVCPKTGRIVGVRKPQGLMHFAFLLVGLLALVWFLVRVAPRPSRAAYPCQRVAMPLASGFVLWLTGIAASSLAFRKARVQFRQARYVTGIAALAVALLGVGWTVASQNGISQASVLPERVEYVPHPPNQPIGVAKGLMPGRVVWVHDPAVTDWGGPDSGQLWYAAVNQSVASGMVSRALRSYSNEDTDAAAWDAIFRSFNGGAGYQPGEKIVIKINLTTSNYGFNCADENYDQLYQNSGFCWGIDDYSIGPSPQLMFALLDQLVHVVHVAQEDITIGDSSALFVNHLYNPLHDAFPDVIYMDKRGTMGRTLATLSTTRLHWSAPPDEIEGKDPDYVLAAAKSAKYAINLAVLKTHHLNGITVTAKNHFGSMVRTPDPGAGNNYYNLHNRLPLQPTSQMASMGQYRPLVDLNGHDDIGGKTVLFLVDGLYGGWNWVSTPTQWELSPINDDWPSSVFVSMDQVAIDSVAFDLLSEQWPDHTLANEGVQDYLHEMAQADNPPSGTFYDPEGDGARLSSMGVHEHWNNPVEKKYSRDLGTGDGIELVLASNAPPAAPTGCGTQPILFVANSGSLGPGDQALVAHLRAAGYTVTVIDDNVAQSSDAVGNDLVMISSSVDPLVVGAKFRSVTVPVIVWQYDLYDDMQMVKALDWTYGGTSNQSVITMQNDSHPLAAGLPSGWVTTTSRNLVYSWGRPPASADIVAGLANHPEKSTIFAYETGRAMVGIPAPARRVAFFSGDGNVYTANGWKLFDAAVQWAVKCSSATSLTLVNGDTGHDIRALADGDTINLADMPTQNLNIRATVAPAIVGSVAFTYDGDVAYRTDNTSPYMLEEPAVGEALPNWTPGLGSHSLAVIPFSSANRGGRAGASLAVSFDVVSQPLALILASFDAENDGDHVLVTWQTVSEMGNGGFNLYRSMTQSGERTLLTTIPSQVPGGMGGATYSYGDTAVTPGGTYWYWLEAVDLNGAATMFEPVSVTFQTPTAVALSGLNADAGSSGPPFLLLAAVALVVLAAVYARFRRVSAS